MYKVNSAVLQNLLYMPCHTQGIPNGSGTPAPGPIPLSWVPEQMNLHSQFKVSNHTTFYKYTSSIKKYSIGWFFNMEIDNTSY